MIAFLDDDHVLRMIQGLLTARTSEDWARVTAFFAPDVVDVAGLRRLRAGLEAGPGETAVLVLRRGRVTRELIESSPGLRLVQRLGRRQDGIDLEASREHGVEVSCLPRPSLVRTAEHTILLMLALTKRLIVADREVRSGVSRPGAGYNWAGLTGLGGLSGRTLGIVGLGEVGGLVAERARAFGMRVIYHNRTGLSGAYRSLPDLLAEADVVSLHAKSATPVIGRAEIAAMRPGALLVNTSRGRLIDEDALYDALVTGRLGGAGLDVHQVEPRPPGDRFCALDNVVLTPHIAGGSRLDVLDEVALMFDNIRHALAANPPPHGRVGGTG
ncbi:D-glycerate dehydrogenase [Acrocarpospora corrugata]|uniref:D-glycerate dehydrogenase n=1 Tax=Acrocarpospora corrugata TaxID=35763 RepID=A0A5M3WBV6_9ACTN|nr:NAD(P)-dependent oxidoreductase [Acrocarpospora corrugata]GES05710.1 D-glycerate dehydrogenase [Acrocarpospora corrugata]